MERDSLLAAIAPLHPVSLNPQDIPGDVLQQLRIQHEPDVAALQAMLDAQSGHQDSPPAAPLSSEDLLRLMLVLRFNAHYRCEDEAGFLLMPPLKSLST